MSMFKGLYAIPKAKGLVIQYLPLLYGGKRYNICFLITEVLTYYFITK